MYLYEKINIFFNFFMLLVFLNINYLFLKSFFKEIKFLIFIIVLKNINGELCMILFI